MLEALYPITGTISIVGLAAVAYGLQGGHWLILAEGIFLAWLGFSLSLQILRQASE
jgi:hypothetical protein